MELQGVGEGKKVSKRSRDNLKPREKRSDSKPRVNASLDELTHKRLQKLAAACRAGGDDTVTKTSIAALALFSAVRSPQFILDLQAMYNTPQEARIYPKRTDDGDLVY